MSVIKYTKKQFDLVFGNDDVCLDYLFKTQYQNTQQCPNCKRDFKFHKIANKKHYSCQWCSHSLSPAANTIFHKSCTSLKDWFYAIYLFSVSKNGVSGKELQRQLGVTYKTAWRIANHIRKLMIGDSNLLKGIVKIDETYVGGKESNKHKDKKTPDNQGRSLKTKSAILGAIQREGNIVAKVVTNTQSSIIKPFIRENICITAQVKTDEYAVYNSVAKMGYDHATVDHGRGEYVNGDAHTNNLEGFWSQLKRCINGTYHFVSPKYLQSYVNEFAFRYNHRSSEIHLFDLLLANIK